MKILLWIAEDEPAHYLILGDFGGRATEPLAVDRDNLDAVMGKLQVSLAGAAFRELDDFHPDNLYRNLSLFREFDVEPRVEQAETLRSQGGHCRDFAALQFAGADYRRRRSV